MRLRVSIAWMMVVLAVTSFSPAWAQQHIADPSAIEAALAAKETRDAANRTTLSRTLRKPEVQAAATRLGMTVERADMAVRSLSGDELESFATQARVIDEDLAGGAQTITISITTLLLIL